MGNSIGLPAALPVGRITHELTGAVITIDRHNSQMIQRLAGDLTAAYPIAYQIGANRVGHTFLVQIGSYLFESPASWYRSHGWDFSPGYANEPELDFDRLVDARCLFCHSDRPEFSGAEGHRFSKGQLSAISCDRCHGPGEEHARHPSAANIVNPVKLTPTARDSICEQCHLEGMTRMLNPGKRWLDFQPGEVFEQVAVTYLGSRQGRTAHAVSQSEQLASSKCMTASGERLWCATCHNPHKQKTEATEVRVACVSCHPSLSKAAHPAPPSECVSCHMPRLTADDIPHAANTDHSIPRQPRRFDQAGNAAPDTLVPWREPPAEFRDRDLGLAEIIAGDRYRSAALHESGTRMLEQLPVTADEKDAKLLTALAGDALEKGNVERGLALARRAVESAPDSGLAAFVLAKALRQTGDIAGAEREYQRATEVDPSSKEPWIELVKLYQAQGQVKDSLATIDRYLEWNPQSIIFRTLRKEQAGHGLR
jgi:Tetratricopeptide repeat